MNHKPSSNSSPCSACCKACKAIMFQKDKLSPKKCLSVYRRNQPSQSEALRISMTVVRGRSSLQGLEWSSICGPEAGSVPTVPWQENVQPSQPRQLGYSQGAMENWRAAVPRSSRGSFEGRGDESRTRCFILFWYHKDMAFAILWGKPNLDLGMGDVHPLAGMSGGGGLAEFLTTSKRCEFMPALKFPALVMMNI